MKMKRSILFFSVGIVMGLYTTFVLTLLWNWFAVLAFHLEPISFWLMYGLTMLFTLLKGNANGFEEEQRNKVLDVLLDACVPDSKREGCVNSWKR